MTFEEFETLVETSLERLPARFSGILRKNGIQVLARQSAPLPLKKQFPDKIVFGVFIGVPYGRFVNMQSEPTRIELYKESFEKVFKDNNEAAHQIRSTVVHEIAHYFGFSEAQIRKLGY